MHKEESLTDLGTIKIHRNVIASIASLAAIEIEGVKRVGGDFTSGIMELLGKKSLNSIRVEFDKNDEVKIEIPLVIKYGWNIPDTASKAQESIRAALEKMTSLIVKGVHVIVQGIEKV